MSLAELFAGLKKQEDECPSHRIAKELDEWGHQQWDIVEFKIYRVTGSVKVVVRYDGVEVEAAEAYFVFQPLDDVDKEIEQMKAEIEAEIDKLLSRPTFRQWVDEFYSEFPQVKPICVEAQESHKLWFDVTGDFEQTRMVQQKSAFGRGMIGGEYHNSNCNPFAFGLEEARKIAVELLPRIEELIAAKSKREARCKLIEEKRDRMSELGVKLK